MAADEYIADDERINNYDCCAYHRNLISTPDNQHDTNSTDNNDHDNNHNEYIYIAHELTAHVLHPFVHDVYHHKFVHNYGLSNYTDFTPPPINYHAFTTELWDTTQRFKFQDEQEQQRLQKQRELDAEAEARVLAETMATAGPDGRLQLELLQREQEEACPLTGVRGKVFKTKATTHVYNTIHDQPILSNNNLHDNHIHNTLFRNHRSLADEPNYRPANLPYCKPGMIADADIYRGHLTAYPKTQANQAMHRIVGHNLEVLQRLRVLYSKYCTLAYLKHHLAPPNDAYEAP